MIPDETVERVREAADVVAIIGEYVKLKRAGSSFRGPCPFHQGTHDNFSVNPRGGYTCFVCGEKGDVFTFIRKYLGLDFVGAVKLVGERAGISVEEVKGHAPEKDPREPFWEINAAAAEFFSTQLANSDVGKNARAYLESRKLALEDAAKFKIGFAPNGDALTRHLSALGFSEQRQLEAGLLVLPEGKTQALVRFRNRLMFPIADANGNIVGFGGRLLGPGEPKYLNSSDSPHFSKRGLLYGMHFAKNAIRKADRVFVVEGYFDVIRMALAGIEEVVAPMGTALTLEQANLIKKYTHNIYLLYDSDGAGLRATFRSGDVMLAAGLAPQVISLPEGDDPDTFASKHGLPGVNREIAKAIDVFDRKIQILERAGYFSDISRKREAVDKLIATIRVATDPISRALYIARAAEVSGLPGSTLEAEVAQLIERDAKRGKVALPSEPWGPSRPAPRLPYKDVPTSAARSVRYPPEGFLKERELIRTLLKRRDFVYKASRELDLDHFRDPIHRHVFAVLLEDAEASVDEIAAGLEESAVEVFQDLLAGGPGMNHEAVVQGGIASLLGRDAHDELVRLQRAYEFVIEMTRLEEKRDRIGKKIIKFWERVGLPPSDDENLSVDALLIRAGQIFDLLWEKAKAWRALRIPKWKATPYPVSPEQLETVRRFKPDLQTEGQFFGRMAAAV